MLEEAAAPVSVTCMMQFAECDLDRNKAAFDAKRLLGKLVRDAATGRAGPTAGERFRARVSRCEAHAFRNSLALKREAKGMPASA